MKKPFLLVLVAEDALDDVFQFFGLQRFFEQADHHGVGVGAGNITEIQEEETMMI